MDYINLFIDTYNIPLLTAFLLGILTSLSPCPLATNITAIAYISREIKTIKNVLLNGLFYTVGRGTSYTVLATLIYLGFSSFRIANIFEGWGEKMLGPVLIIISLAMFGVIRMNLGAGSERLEKIKIWLSGKGYFGSLLLGMLFALAFCPYSGVLYFGILIPLTISASEGLLLPPVFAIGTGLPVIVFSFLISFSVKKISRTFHVAQKVEKIMRLMVASIFLIVGLYYLYLLIKFLLLSFLN